jgi:hypothetical protein
MKMCTSSVERTVSGLHWFLQGVPSWIILWTVEQGVRMEGKRRFTAWCTGLLADWTTCLLAASTLPPPYFLSLQWPGGGGGAYQISNWSVPALVLAKNSWWKAKLSMVLINHHAIKTCGTVEIQLHSFMTSALMEFRAPAALPPDKGPRYHCERLRAHLSGLVAV